MTHDCQPDRSLASNRDAAMAYAARYLDDGSFEKELAHLISIPSESQIPMRALDLKRYLDEGISPILKRLGFSLHQIETAEDINDVHALPTLLATRIRRVAASMERTSGATTNVIPNNSASNPSSLFQDALSVPTIWIPWSHPGCGQHGPDEHALLPLFREGLQITAGLWWDLGDPAFLEDFQ